MTPLPIPPGLTPAHAAAAGNWPLFQTLCQKAGTLSLRQGREAVGRFSVCAGPEEEQSCAAALACLLDACPQLIRSDAACQKLIHCYLRFHECAVRPLAPWVERIQDRSVVMSSLDWNDPNTFLERWPLRLPNGPVPALDRNSSIFFDSGIETLFALEGSGGPLTRQQFEALLGTCPIRGKAKKGVLSPLAHNALQYVSPAFLDTLFLPGGLLDTEDPKALLDYALSEDCPRTKRALVMAHVRQEAAYAL